MSTIRYQLLPADRSADDLEQELLARWREERLFERTLEARAGSPRFVFYDGPPTANGRPGIHHVFARTVKDLFCRHRTMTGHLVARKAGWDTHGLPVEIEVEKALGLSGKPDIEAFGVEAFNARCRESVWTYRKEWERLVERVANWMDYDHPYVTYTNDYIESEWWALKTLYEKGLLYRGHKILPYCARCGTALSSHEVAQGYEDVEDPSLYVALDLVGDGSRETGDGNDGAQRRRVIVWTTTPWTLVSNVALAVHPDLEYVELRKKTGAEWTIILAAARAMAVLGDDYTDRWDVVQRLTGNDLVGRRYRRPLDWVPFDEGSGAHEVIVPADFVSAEDGSGIVHMA
ncbi:MAG: class I tRNA ligase family protein, partial [Gemmatimonadota bacterium]